MKAETFLMNASGSSTNKSHAIKNENKKDILYICKYVCKYVNMYMILKEGLEKHKRRTFFCKYIIKIKIILFLGNIQLKNEFLYLFTILFLIFFVQSY